MITTNTDGYHNKFPLGTFNNPVKLTGPIPEEYPAEFKDQPFIYVQETDGEVTKVYRSYSDACD